MTNIPPLSENIYFEENQDSFTYKKSIYYHPVMDATPTYSLINFTLMFQEEKVTSMKRKKHFVLSETPEQELHVLLSGYDILPFDKDTCSPYVLLYREGSPHPLSCISCEGLEEENTHAFCLPTSQPLTAGRYFLYFPGAHCSIRKQEVTEIESGLCCAFQLLTPGKQLKKPYLNHALLSVKWTRETSPYAWSKGAVQVIADIALSDDVTTEIDYSLFCFNQHSILMGKQKVYGKKRRAPEFQIRSRKPWKPGVYTAIAVCNREPVASIVFEMSTTGEIIHARLAELPSDDFYYEYVRTLERCEMEDLNEEKRKLLHLYRSRQLAVKKKQQQRSEIILFTAEEEETALQTAKQYEYILSVGSRSLLYIDVANENHCRFLANGVFKEACYNRTFVLYNNHHLLKNGNPLLKALQDLSIQPQRGITFVLCLSDRCLTTIQTLHPEIIRKVQKNKHIHTDQPPMTKQANNQTNPMQKAFDAAMHELNDMVGLHSLKESLTDLFTLIQFAEQRRRLGLPTSEKVPRHLLFTGNPGTGKTTVAKLFGKIYHSLGLLSDGEVVVTERSQLVGEHIGSTEEKTRAMLEASKGKVLFIDEAYTLCDSTDSRIDYGYRVIETLLTTLSEEGSDRVIILAGYKEEMQQLLQANRGLESRFNAHFEFEDYSVEELMQIAENKLISEYYQLTPAAREALLQLVSEVVSHKNSHFGNARWMLHRIEHGIIPAMARRVMKSDAKADLALYTHILEEDVRSAKEAIQLTPVRSRPKIGFVA